MKPCLVVFALACCVASKVAVHAQTDAPVLESMKIHVRNLPAFPITLVARGVTQGTVRIAVKVDEEGQLVDHLIVGYTDAALAHVAVNSLKDWQFTPARLDGEPVPAQSEVVFNFRAEGVVVNQHMVEHYLGRLRPQDSELVYQPTSLRDLDQIPTPVHVVSPIYTPEMSDRGLRGEVTIDFYIDEQGRVRMPVGPANQNQELAALAMQAVAQWQFEPPTRRGKPVLVLARQRFNFTGPSASPPAAAPPPAPTAP